MTRPAEFTDKLIALIARGRLRPGERINESELAAEFGVSVTPIREALLSVSWLPFIRRERYRGFLIAELSPEDAVHSYESIALLEGAILRTSQPDRATLDLLDDINTRFALSKGDPHLASQHDLAWHSELIDIRGNPTLGLALAAARLSVARYKPIAVRCVGIDLDESSREHAEIVRLLRIGSFHAASSLLEANWTSNIPSVVEALLPGSGGSASVTSDQAATA